MLDISESQVCPLYIPWEKADVPEQTRWEPPPWRSSHRLWAVELVTREYPYLSAK